MKDINTLIENNKKMIEDNKKMIRNNKIFLALFVPIWVMWGFIMFYLILTKHG